MSVGGFNYGDMIIQLVFFIILIALVVGIILLVVKFSKRNNQLNRIEEKIDKLLSDKEK